MKKNTPVRIVSLFVLASAALTAQVARQQNLVPLKNWAAPLYWQPSHQEREASSAANPQLQFSPNAVSTTALTFVGITPCRLVDTRGASAGFNGIAPFSGPSIAALGTLTIPVQSSTEATMNTTPAPCGPIPSIAQAYSFNVTVVPHAPGAVDYVSLWPSGSTQPFVATLNDPQGAIVSNAAVVPAGTSQGGISVYNAGPSAADVIIDMNGYFAAPTDSGGNTVLGSGALTSNTSGGNNTADGFNALQNNTSGTFNTATGSEAMQYNTTGSNNTADGYFALWFSTTGGNNTAAGSNALYFNNAGAGNTAVGYQALYNNTTGNNNIAVGNQAASSVSAANSNNIHIGNVGAPGDSGVIKIGTAGTHTSAIVAGITGTNVSGGVNVLVDANGQLGTVLSSQRFKDQIVDMGAASTKLLELRPVNFFYKPEFDDGSHQLQYGLIAEEVAKVYPEMVAYDNDGQILTVKYQMLAPMLLNEVQKQSAENHRQAEQIQSLEQRLAALEALLNQ